ncbi:hypothetical protein J1N35_039928 [Gossypium stocksii]|uniref:Uncharacterized protein n=1 Tax=Gossypium stocksii TaxID=47602 RepID=A0A9D3ZH89_9ROSI|nr:hypothetical protein J1N35_039928 [Gossypium stocksii]
MSPVLSARGIQIPNFAYELSIPEGSHRLSDTGDESSALSRDMCSFRRSIRIDRGSAQLERLRAGSKEKPKSFFYNYYRVSPRPWVLMVSSQEKSDANINLITVPTDIGIVGGAGTTPSLGSDSEEIAKRKQTVAVPLLLLLSVSPYSLPPTEEPFSEDDGELVPGCGNLSTRELQSMIGKWKASVPEAAKRSELRRTAEEHKAIGATWDELASKWKKSKDFYLDEGLSKSIVVPANDNTTIAPVENIEVVEREDEIARDLEEGGCALNDCKHV